MSNRKWWRQLFLDHPELSRKPSSSNAFYDPTAKAPKPKVACIQCWNVRLTVERDKDEAEVREGKRAAARDRADVEELCEFFTLTI
jgi:hypothetical protein